MDLDSSGSDDLFDLATGPNVFKSMKNYTKLPRGFLTRN